LGLIHRRRQNGSLIAPDGALAYGELERRKLGAPMLSPKPSKVSLIGSAALLVSLGLWPFLASAQSQGDSSSVADAARRAREQKRAAAKPARTLTNDDLPSVLA
jgi:hypothetical protein